MIVSPPSPITIAAQTAWGEARGEGTIGMQAVLNVIANRVADSGWWGHDIVGVCQAHDEHGVHQFSCWNASDNNLAEIRSITGQEVSFLVAQRLAAQLVAGTLHDLTGGADSYLAIGTTRAWAIPQRRTTVIGRQVFYRVGVRGTAPYVRDVAGELLH